MHDWRISSFRCKITKTNLKDNGVITMRVVREGDELST